MTIRLMRSAVIDAPPAAVWALLRDFNSHERWHPAIDKSRMEAGEAADLVGGIRAFTLKDGGFLREQLISLSDREMSLTYCLLEAPIPLQGYVARMQLRPVTDGDRSFLLWESSFTAPEHRIDELQQLVAGGIYEAGLTALQTYFRRDVVGLRSIEAVMARPRSPPTGQVASGRSAEVLRGTAVVMAEYGGPEVLELREVDVPPPARGEVRLRQTAIGVNFIDIHCRRGDFDLVRLPGIPGIEATGLVLDIGDDVTDFVIGGRVGYAGLATGAYAAIRNVPAALLVAIPPDIDDRLLAAWYLKGLMADLLLHDVHPVSPGQNIVVRAAAGGVGLILCQMAKALGATVIGVVSSDAKVSASEQAGCDHVVVQGPDDQSRRFVDEVLALTKGAGVQAVFDNPGGTSFQESLDCLAIRGHLIRFGQSSTPAGVRDLDRLSVRSLTLSRPNFADYMQDRRELIDRVTRLFEWLRQGQVVPRLVTSLPLKDVAVAHRSLEDRRNIGSFVLLP